MPSYEARARSHLRTFRQGSVLAVAITALLLLIWAEPEALTTAHTKPAATSVARDQPEPANPAESLAQATGTLRELLTAFYALLPKIALGWF